MPESSFEKPRRRAKIYGIILAALGVAASLAFVVATHNPRTAVSSPGPAKAAIVPQIADVKSEAEILFRGKSFAVYKRQIIVYFEGTITEIPVKEGQTVKEGDLLAKYMLDRVSLNEIHQVLYPHQVLAADRAVLDLEVALAKLQDVSLPLKNLAGDKTKKELEDFRQLQARNLAPRDAVVNKERELESLYKQVHEVKESIRQTKATLKKARDDLRFYQDKHKRDLKLLEWQTNRPYSDSAIPLDQASLKAPIDSQVIWISPIFQVHAEVPKGFHAMTLAPMSEVVVRCKVHELDLVKIRTGDRGTVSFDAIPDKEYSCRVNRIPWVSRNPALEVPADYEIECVLEKPDSTLKEGLSCNVKVSVTE